MATKPTISNPEIELDARTLVLADGAPVATWPDQSGQGNDGVTLTADRRPSYQPDLWVPLSGIPSVQFLDTGSPPDADESLGYDSTVWGNTELTLFIVGRIIDLSEGGAFIGVTSGGTPPREMDVSVFPDGTLFFGFGTETIPTAIQTNIISAPGVVKEGELLLITCRHTNGAAGVDPEGMLIRLNGKQVASVPSFVTDVVALPGPGAIGISPNTGSPELGLPGGTIFGRNRLIAWIGGYSVAATDQEILDMEAFLAETFLVNVGSWTPSNVAPATGWTPEVIPPATSGVIFLKNGVQVGISDFSEFALGDGLPSGITEYGIGAGSPSSEGIDFDATEGNYFKLSGATSAGGGVNYGFGLDAFDGLIEFGEILARIYLNIGTDLQWGGGPCLSLRGLVGEPSPDMFAAGGTIRRDDDDPEWNTQGNETFAGTVSVPVNNRFMQEPSINGSWLWFRVRRTANIAVPAQDDWEVTAWHGDIGDEPASPDGTATVVTPSTRGIGAIGWFQLFGGAAEQRIAFLSFSADPLLAAPPVPGEEPPVATTGWSPS